MFSQAPCHSLGSNTAQGCRRSRGSADLQSTGITTIQTMGESPTLPSNPKTKPRKPAQHSSRITFCPPTQAVLWHGTCPPFSLSPSFEMVWGWEEGPSPQNTLCTHTTKAGRGAIRSSHFSHPQPPHTWVTTTAQQGHSKTVPTGAPSLSYRRRQCIPMPAKPCSHPVSAEAPRCRPAGHPGAAARNAAGALRKPGAAPAFRRERVADPNMSQRTGTSS